MSESGEISTAIQGGAVYVIVGRKPPFLGAISGCMAALRNSDLSITFSGGEIPICPNNCGEMAMIPLTMRPGDVAPEAFARCPKCKHQMVVGDERPISQLPFWQQRAIRCMQVRY